MAKHYSNKPNSKVSSYLWMLCLFLIFLLFPLFASLEAQTPFPLPVMLENPAILGSKIQRTMGLLA
ncbi:MAG: SGNH/GDSL hydrolase family protein, partial [Microcoleus sp.]